MFLGVGETFKAYKLYDPLTKKVVSPRCDLQWKEDMEMGRKGHSESADSCGS